MASLFRWELKYQRPERNHQTRSNEFEAIIFTDYTCRATMKVAVKCPAWRKTHRAEKIDRYFDFKQFKLCPQIEVCYNFVFLVCCDSF